jgi:hypothetical protein
MYIQLFIYSYLYNFEQSLYTVISIILFDIQFFMYAVQ